MKEKILSPFPGQKIGVIKILIKPSNQNGSVQLKLDLDFKDNK
ncbi:hypothetical protein MKY51_15710 [Solibacillus sp. FSL R5-0691]